jgi:hypothetical protein
VLTRPGLQTPTTPLGTAPLMQHLGTIFRRVLSLALYPFYRLERRHHYPLNRRMAWPQKRSAESAEDTKLKVDRLLCVLSISRIAVCAV